MRAKGSRRNHGWILIALAITILYFRAQYDPLMSIINSMILLLGGIAVVYGLYRDPEATLCSVCAAPPSQSRLSLKTPAIPLVLPIILLIITPMIAVDTTEDADWMNQVVGERVFNEIPDNRTKTNLFQLVNFGNKYDGLNVEVNGSILERRDDGFLLHQYVALCTCCPPIEVTMWVYFPISHNSEYDILVEDATLGKEELYLVIGVFFYDDVQNFASILLIHIEPLTEE